MDRASWPALSPSVLLACPRTPTPHPSAHVCRLGTGAGSASFSALSVPGWSHPSSPPPKPVATQPGESHHRREPWRPPPVSPGCPSEEPRTSPASAAVPENPGTNTGLGSTPEKGQEGGSHSPALSWPFSLQAALLFPRDLSYTGPGGSPPPLREVPSLCPTQGRQVGGPARPALLAFRWSLCWK